MKGPIKDPATYRRMSEPLASAAEAEAATIAFFEELRALREKHHVRDVVAIVQVPYLADGEESMSLVTLTIGSRAEALPMLATAYGCERASYIAAVDKAARGAS